MSQESSEMDKNLPNLAKIGSFLAKIINLETFLPISSKRCYKSLIFLMETIVMDFFDIIKLLNKIYAKRFWDSEMNQEILHSEMDKIVLKLDKILHN